MIIVTIEGPQGSGKSTIARAIISYCSALGKSVVAREECTDAALEKYKPDVMIVTKMTSR